MWRISGCVTVFLATMAVACSAVAQAKPQSETATQTAPATKPAKERPDTIAAATQATGATFRPLVRKAKGGRIDWTRGEVRATGTGKSTGTSGQSVAMAKRAARAVAARNVALLLAGIRVGPGGRFAKVRRGRLSVDAILTGLREVASRFDSKTRTATVTLAMPLYGVKGMLVTHRLQLTRPRARWRFGAHYALIGEPSVVIIDARRMRFEPVVLPRLTTGSGQVVFDASDVNGLVLLARGMVAWAKLPDKAPLSARAKVEHPAVILTPVRADPNNAGVLVLDREDLQGLRVYSGTRHVMRQGRVLIVLDEEAPAPSPGRAKPADKDND